MRGKTEAAARALDALGVVRALGRLPAWHGLVVLCYHRIGDAGTSRFDRALYSATQEELDRQVRELARHVELVAGEDIGRALHVRRGRHAAITFDDGYRDNHDLAAPVLRAHGAPATFFLATGFVGSSRAAWWDEVAWMLRTSPLDGLPPSAWCPGGLSFDGTGREDAVRAGLELCKRLPWNRTEEFLRWLEAAAGVARPGEAEVGSTWMTWDMARAMQAQGFQFGAHTMDHPILARCSVAEQSRQVVGSIDRIEVELGERPRVFAYPVGHASSFTEETRACLAGAGVTVGLSFYGGWQAAGDGDPLDVRRIHVSPSISPARFRAQLTLPRLFARRVSPP